MINYIRNDSDFTKLHSIFHSYFDIRFVIGPKNLMNNRYPTHLTSIIMP